MPPLRLRATGRTLRRALCFTALAGQLACATAEATACRGGLPH